MRWKLRQFFTMSFTDKVLEDRYNQSVWSGNSRLIRIMSLFFVLFWIYNTINYYFISSPPSDIDVYATTIRWSIFTPSTFLILFLALIGPFHNTYRRKIWYVVLSIYSIYFGFSSALKTSLCISGRITTNCDPEDRPALQNTDFYAIIGPFVILLIMLNNRGWQSLAMIAYITIYVIAINLAGLANSFLTFVPLLILIGGYMLALAVSYIQENQNRLRFLLRNELEKEVTIRREAQMKQDEAEKEKDAFASYIFHEIRVPLNVVTLSINLLDRDATFASHLDEEESDFYTKIKFGIHSIESVLNDTVDYTNLRTGGFVRIIDAPFNLLNAFESMVWIMESQWNEKNLQLIKQYDNRLYSLETKVIGDENRLRQMTNNYLSNAIKFTPTGGTLTLIVNIENETENNITIYVAVKDTGIGISKENQQKLFKPFVQIDPQKSQGGKGSGLGLSIVASILNVLDGTYGVESELGSGSTFWYRVTLRKSTELLSASEGALSGSSDEYCDRQLYVLVVDDDKITRFLVSRIFKQLGHITDLAVDGLDCIEKFETNRLSEERKYDIIFIDNLMPRMKGVEAIEWIRSRGYDIPIVSFTATSDALERQVLLDAGANHVLSKPSSITDIEHTLGSLQRSGK